MAYHTYQCNGFSPYPQLHLNTIFKTYAGILIVAFCRRLTRQFVQSAAAFLICLLTLTE
ncbi:uncharacterized protein FA14DRAFT_162130 [Meira miltonrushii]|uniref:Uncharacterized protein n=1 Tax=Meira miltonrushii TaxID=1280837 RepID=A0A316V5P5_9BASI|nr:uncharacterized protein FA14DRAFT_162130 [Meira miltonrushii]PWN32897.1 hypothetical protein FA14DRAFT_162130 [Meira miltonrushii]